MQLSHTFLVFLFLLFIVGIALAGSSTARRSRVRHHNIKVRINATGDTIVMKFVRPNADTKLEGYILGYGSSMFSKQFIQLPENGLPYETEIDAEPKYLIAVQPIPVNDVKKQCPGNVNLEKPLHLVIGSVTPTSVLLSWGTLLKTPYEGNIMNDCLEDGNYTVRYRERNRKWTYQTCPASDTVIDSLKPNTAYEFGIRPNNKERSGVWSKPVLHNTNMSGKAMQKPYKPRTPLKPVKTVNMPRAFFPPRHAVHNRSQGRTLFRTPVAPRTTFDKLMDLKQGDKASILRSFPLVTAKPTKQKTTTLTPALNATGDNSSVFSSLPTSEVDAMGKKRFVAPHVIYKTDKKPDEPCSITKSLSFFPEEEGVEQNITAPPRLPPSNLTVVTVEGCPSFVILDWEKTDNDTTEYEVISRTHGPNGEEVSILTTNQTHTAVENLKPENSYEFKVKPKNELGEGPASEPVLFNTESADPRVSENVSGKDAIWTQFPFKADSYSECNGKQYVKRTWYRKFVGIQLCNSLRYKIYMSDSLTGKFYNIGDQTGHGEDHCQFVDSFLDGQTGSQLLADQLPSRSGFYRAMRQEPVNFGEIGGNSHATYVGWYECGTPIPGKW
uniref:target of Nesh-SH3-like isoform X8 n=1 Tax=Oncorhynchus gorbuscha TaxID=8017 RepID=UPI001EAEF28D|nr:target of Nesh-SH3-like isoform X8 [Oncorhynchus gorbuscha]